MKFKYVTTDLCEFTSVREAYTHAKKVGGKVNRVPSFPDDDETDLVESEYEVDGGVPKKNYAKDLQKKHQKTNKKGAMGYFMKRNAGNPQRNMEIFNHMTGADSVPSGGEASGGESGGGMSMGEDYNNGEYILYQATVHYPLDVYSMDLYDLPTDNEEDIWKYAVVTGGYNGGKNRRLADEVEVYDIREQEEVSERKWEFVNDDFQKTISEFRH